MRIIQEHRRDPIADEHGVPFALELEGEPVELEPGDYIAGLPIKSVDGQGSHNDRPAHRINFHNPELPPTSQSIGRMILDSRVPILFIRPFDEQEDFEETIAECQKAEAANVPPGYHLVPARTLALHQRFWVGETTREKYQFLRAPDSYTVQSVALVPYVPSNPMFSAFTAQDFPSGIAVELQTVEYDTPSEFLDSELLVPVEV